MKVSSAQYAGSVVDLNALPPSGLPEVGFAGRSNVGKSSLINCLVGVKGLAHTSSTPGRTRCLNFYLINSSFYFVDLPGYGYARVSKQMRSSFRGMVESYLKSRLQLKGMILILDGRHGAMSSDLLLRDWLIHEGLPFRVVLTKMDKIPFREWARVQTQAARLLGGERDRILLFSAATGEGKKEVWQAIEEMLGGLQKARRKAKPMIPTAPNPMRKGHGSWSRPSNWRVEDG
ncbi:MAG: ribosome biogenesis GTP-binding protein YihA/YsxC [candidate division NC10 bacterium]|nr:ribosome biogenesis GTP-binding protein YihA/YsxC [candidate division NC10 bacterium]